MSAAGHETEPEWLSAVRKWRQGDFTTDIDHIVLVDEVEGGSLTAKLGSAIGLAVITQTCDIVNFGPEKEWVTVAALREVDEQKLKHISAGRTPIFAELECPPAANVVVDLTQVMTIHKKLLSTFKRNDGFKTDSNAVRFADVLSRKHGRFAFPDKFSSDVLGPLRDRIRGKHGKDSDQGKAYRSISSVRASASPNWDAESVKVGFRFLLLPEGERSTDRSSIRNVVEDLLKTIKWPDGFSPEDPGFTLETAAEMTVEAWLNSNEIDWKFISWT